MANGQKLEVGGSERSSFFASLCIVVNGLVEAEPFSCLSAKICRVFVYVAARY